MQEFLLYLWLTTHSKKAFLLYFLMAEEEAESDNN